MYICLYPQADADMNLSRADVDKQRMNSNIKRQQENQLILFLCSMSKMSKRPNSEIENFFWRMWGSPTLCHAKQFIRYANKVLLICKMYFFLIIIPTVCDADIPKKCLLNLISTFKYVLFWLFVRYLPSYELCFCVGRWTTVRMSTRTNFRKQTSFRSVNWTDWGGKMLNLF